jgi:hypothetical protein
MKSKLILLLALAFIRVSAYGEPSNEYVGLDIPANGQTVYEDMQIKAALKTNFSAKVHVFVDNLLVATNSFTQGQVSITVPVAKPGTNTFRVEVWQTGAISVGVGQEPDFSGDALILEYTGTVVREYRLTAAGWIFLIFGWSTIISLAVFSYSRIFGIRKDKIVEPLEIDTGDE